MTNQFNDQLKINKVHTSSSRGYELGSTNATWKKIKQATNIPVDKSLLEEETIVVNGKLGELLIIFPISKVLEVWYWIPPSDNSITKDFSGDTLYFYGQYDIAYFDDNKDAIQLIEDEEDYEDNSIKSLDIIDGDLNNGYTMLVSYNSLKLQIQFLDVTSSETSLIQNLQLPEFLQSKSYSVKLNSKFIIVGDNNGFMYVFKYDSALKKFIPANANDGLKNLKKNTCLPILRKHNFISKLSDREILFKTSCLNDKPIFDLNNNWLVYSPTKIEYNQIKIDNENQVDNLLTPVKLPTNSRPLLNTVLESISNTALDQLFKFSKFSTTKLSEYFKPKDEDKKDHDELSLKNLTKSLNKIFNSTISSINETTNQLFKISDNQLIKIVDLSNDKILTIFKSPDGISNLSLSPYDLQLINCNLRGDNFFIWDLIKLPQQVSLLGKFSRGKTSGIIDDIFWFINNNDENSNDLYKGINSGFGTINSKTGSIHWFNINYLLGNLNNNLPNYLGKEFPINSMHIKNKEFMNNWILSSSTKYKKFFKLPNLSNLNNNNFNQLSQLAVLDDSNQLKLISPLNGNNCFKFELPINKINPDLKTTISSSKIPEFDDVIKSLKVDCNRNNNSISQIEIETCKPFKHLINFKNIEFAVYDFQSDKSDDINFDDYYQMFNNSIPSKKIQIENTSASVNDVAQENEFVERLVDDLFFE